MTARIQANLEPEIDRLYQLPLDEFVQARNDLATRMRAEGDEALAMRVHSLAKPSVSAWAVNQLYWRARPEFDALRKAGEKLRAAQEATLAGRGADVRQAGKQRDAALVAALERTLDLLREAGHPPTPAMRLRLATDLDALAAYGGAPPGVSPGRLAEDLDAPGFEVFAGMRAPARKTAKAEPPRRPRKRATAQVVSFEEIAGARRAVKDAERAAAEDRARAQQADEALEQAQADVTTARTEEARAKSAWEDAQRRREQAERRVPERAQEAEAARRAAREAGEAIERARAALDAVKNDKRRRP